jgi:2'-5' RNA ligase
MTDRVDRRLYLFAPLPPRVNRFISLSEDLAPAWRTRDLVQTPRRHVTLLDLNLADQPLGRMIRHARRFVADALPEAFRINVDELVVTRRQALLVASEPVQGVRRAQAELLAAADREGLALPQAAQVRPHVTLGYNYVEDRAVERIDGISWQVDELRLVLSHVGDTVHEILDSWALPGRRMLAA